MSFLLGSTASRRHGGSGHSHGGGGHSSHRSHVHGDNCKHGHGDEGHHGGGGHRNGGGGGVGNNMPWLVPSSSRVVPTKESVTMADLYRAVDAGDLPLTYYIIVRLGISVKVKDPGDNTPMHVAAKRGWVNIARYLVEAGCSVNDMNEKGHTPLMWAVTNGHLPMVQALISLGADINAADKMGFTAAIHAAQSGNLFVLHYILATGIVDVNQVDIDGHTALCWACYNGHLHLVEYLLHPRLCPCYAHLGILDKQGKSVLHWAAAQGHIPVIHRLLLANCETCQSSGSTNNHHHHQHDSVDLSSSDPSSTSTLSTSTEMVRCTVTSGQAMVRLRDAEGNTPAQCASLRNLPLVAIEVERSNSHIKDKTKLNGNPEVYTRELVAQVVSGFVPHFLTMFWAVFAAPWWVILLAIFLSVWLHGSGILKWTIMHRTLVPAGIMASALLLMCFVSLHMNLSSTQVITLYMGVVWIGYTYYSLHIVDPGVIHHSEDDLKKALDLATHGMEPSSDYCRTCRIIKPPRTKHCRACGTCTARHDHHCVWIYNCVALKNTWLFYNFLWSIICTLVPFQIWAFSYFKNTTQEGETIMGRIPRAFAEDPQIAWSIVFYLLVLIPILMLTFHHTKFVSSDMTTYEAITHKPQSKNTMSIKRYIAFILRGTDVFSMPSPIDSKKTHHNNGFASTV